MNLWAAFLILLTRIGWGICQLLFKNSSEMQAAAFISQSALIAFLFLAILGFAVEHKKVEMLETLFNQLDFAIMFFSSYLPFHGSYRLAKTDCSLWC